MSSDAVLREKMRADFVNKRRRALGIEDEPVTSSTPAEVEPAPLPDIGSDHIWLHDVTSISTFVPIPIKVYEDDYWAPEVRKYIPEPITGYKYRQAFIDFAICHEMGMVGALVGEPGCGKDAMAYQLAAIKRMPYRRIMGDRNKTQDTIIGRRTMQDGNILWEPGELELVSRYGGMVVLSEPFAFPPDTLFAIQSMIERNGFLSLVEHPDPDQRMLKLHPDTRVVLTTNTRGVGDDNDKYAATGVMDASTLNRLEYMQVVPHLDPGLEAAVVNEIISDISMALNMVRFGNLLRQAWRVGEIEASWSLRNLVPWAELIKKGFPVNTSFKMTYHGKFHSDKERETVDRLWRDCGFSVVL